MVKVDYVKKMKNILSNQSQFQKVLDDDSITNLAKFQRFLYFSKKKNFFAKDIYEQIRPSSAVTSILYGLPKLHKKKEIHVSLSWHQTVVIHMNVHCGKMRYLHHYENTQPTS